jgi:hypothetical protein
MKAFKYEQLNCIGTPYVDSEPPASLYRYPIWLDGRTAYLTGDTITTRTVWSVSPPLNSGACVNVKEPGPPQDLADVVTVDLPVFVPPFTFSN